MSHVTTSWVWVRGEKVSHVTASCVRGQASHTKQAKGNRKATRVSSLSSVFFVCLLWFACYVVLLWRDGQGVTCNGKLKAS